MGCSLIFGHTKSLKNPTFISFQGVQNNKQTFHFWMMFWKFVLCLQGFLHFKDFTDCKDLKVF